MALPAGTTQSCSIPALFVKRCERRQTASSGKRHNETPTVRKTPPLPLRPMLRTPQPHMSDAAGMRTRRERSERSVRTPTPPALQECQMRLASHARRDAPKEVERPAPPHRRGETPHLLVSSLIAICDWASSGKRHNETPTVRKTPPLPLRTMLRTPQPHMSDAGGPRLSRPV